MIISIICIFSVPLLMVFILNIERENNLNYLTFYKNVGKSVFISPLSFLLQLFILLSTIYVIGGITGRKILKEKMNPYKRTFISLNLIWLYLFMIAMINEVIISVNNFGLTPEIIGSITVAWLVYGFVLFISASLIYSSILSIFISREFKSAIKKE